MISHGELFSFSVASHMFCLILMFCLSNLCSVRLRTGKKKSWSIIIDGMDQAKLRLPHLYRNTHALQGKKQISMKLTGVLVAGAPIPCFAYINSEHYGGSSNLTCTVLMDVLRRLAAMVRKIAAERKRKGEDPALDPAMQRKLNKAVKKNERFADVLKRMGINTVQNEEVAASETIADETPRMGQDCEDDSEDDDPSTTMESALANKPSSSEMDTADSPLVYDELLEKLVGEISEERRNRIRIDLSEDNVSTWPSRLYVQLDNSGKDNKNSIVFLFLALLVYYGVFKVVQFYSHALA